MKAISIDGKSFITGRIRSDDKRTEEEQIERKGTWFMSVFFLCLNVGTCSVSLHNSQ